MERMTGLREKKLYRMLNGALLSGMGMFGGWQLSGMGELSGFHLAAAFFVLCLLAGLDFLTARGRVLCLTAILACLWSGAAFAGRETSLSFLYGFFPWIARRDEVPAEWVWGYELMLTAAIVASAWVLQLLFEKVSFLKLVFAGLLLAGLVCCLFLHVEIPHMGVVFLLCYIAMVYVEWTQERWEKVRSGAARCRMLWLMPFLGVYLLLTACMPAPEEPYGWPWVTAAYGKLRETFLTYAQRIHWGGREGFGMTFSGFTEDGGLHGDLQEEAREVMTIRLEEGYLRNVYLTGLTYDAFDGREWQQTYQGSSFGTFLDAFETFCAVQEYNGRFEPDYLREARLQVRYRYFNSKFLFAPLKTWTVEGSGKSFRPVSEDGKLMFPKRNGYGTEYALEYFQLNTGQEEFYRFLEVRAGEGALGEDGAGSVSSIPDETALEGALAFGGENRYETDLDEAILREMGIRCGEGKRTFSPELLTEHRKGIYERYTSVPALSDEAAEYLKEITAGAETEVEKLRAIERELSSYAYTKTPGDLPDWVMGEEEFLDYFLLGERRGYCTYFATAFVLLARAEGIPARYVQGYCVPVERKGETYVYSDMAHAWPEAYISGVGWIPFEPTPGYGKVRYTPWRLRQSEEEAVSKEPVGVQVETQDQVGQPGGLEESRTEPQEPEENTLEEISAERERFLRMLALALALMLAGCGAVLLADNGLGRYRYRRMGAEGRFRLEVRRNLRVLALFGVEREDQETLQELRERGTARLEELATPMASGVSPEADPLGGNRDSGKAPTRKKTALREDSPELREVGHRTEEATYVRTKLRFIEDYEEIIYGGRPVSEDLVSEAMEERRFLLEILKIQNPWVYIYCRLRLYLMRYR